MAPLMEALIKWVTDLQRVGHEACHCIEEFTLRWIRSPGRREKLAFECLRLADLSRDPIADKALNFLL
jgi:hypothetical protein